MSASGEPPIRSVESPAPRNLTLPLVIPPRLAAGSSQGGVTRLWIEQLPGQIAWISAWWGLDVFAPYLPGGYRGWTAPCIRKMDNVHLVLKCTPPGWEVAQVQAMKANKGSFLPRIIDWMPGAILMERLVGDTLSDQPDSLQRDSVPEILAGLKTLEAQPASVALADLLPGYMEAIDEATTSATRDIWQRWKQLPCPSDALVAIHGDLHEEHIFLGPPVRGIDPNPAIAPLAWEVEPLTRRYLDRADAQGLELLLEVLGTHGLRRESILYYAMLRAQYYHALTLSDSWRWRVLGLAAAANLLS